VIRPKLDSFKGIVVSNGICPQFSDVDAYHMTACAIDEAVRNAVCVGANIDHMAGLDNFCWCDPVKSERNPDGEHKLAQLVRSNQAIYDYCTAYGVPCISGKDSMKNDYIMGDIKISIPPTLLYSTISTIDDVRSAITMDFKSDGDLIYVLGMTRPEMAGSEYYQLLGHVGNSVPKVNASEAYARYKAVNRAMKEKLIRSCHDCSDGGLGVAVAESAFSGGLGATINLKSVPAENIDRCDIVLFSESQSRLVVSIKEQDQARFEKVMGEGAFALIGKVKNGNELSIDRLNGSTESVSLTKLKEMWQAPLKDL